ncbi:hypothetical protein [Azorhizobium caulinodans]|jgi:hypothetical protein|uniref:hypothetical protein n=1 Tax=Azorhizobium caulinodans TaxID=7 RepID=UPI002FBD4175
MALAAFVEVNAVFWRTSDRIAVVKSATDCITFSPSAPEGAIRKAGQQCVENSLKAGHNLFAGYYRKLMIENPQIIDQHGIMSDIFDNFRHHFYASHVYGALLLKDDHSSFFPKSEFCLTIEESGRQCDRDDATQTDQRHLLGERQGLFRHVHGAEQEVDPEHDGDN